jgi:hypothetical protein
MLDVLNSGRFAREVNQLCMYDTGQMGKVIAQISVIVNQLIVRGEQQWQQQQYRLKGQRQAPGTVRFWTF